MPEAEKLHRKLVMLPKETIDQIEEWMHQNREHSFSNAVRQIVQAFCAGNPITVKAAVSKPETNGHVHEDLKKVVNLAAEDYRGQRFHIDGHAPGKDLSNCPVCHSEKVTDDGLTWKCVNCMWAGTIDGMFAEVTRKIKG
jgi:hypothetical protein